MTLESEPLPGGYINAVVRVGDTVRRPQGPRAEYVHSLLRFLEAHGFEGAPRFLGLDEQGREVLSYIEGHVAWEAEQPPGVWSDESLLEVARLLRRLHDLTEGTELAAGGEVVCHGDLSPKNTVYRDFGVGYRPVAFIDWDLAHAGTRAEGVVDMLWHFLCPCPRHDTPLLRRRLRAMCDAYGLDSARREGLIARMHQHLRDVMYGIALEAARGSRGHQGIMALGGLEHLRERADWVAAHLDDLQEAILA
jgi:aminoglycoside phosphotransferase (APT) family kinase protein